MSLDPACTGKTPYLDRGAALKRLAYRKQSHRRLAIDGRRNPHPYRCKNCGKWHIGSDPK